MNLALNCRIGVANYSKILFFRQPLQSLKHKSALSDTFVSFVQISQDLSLSLPALHRD